MMDVQEWMVGRFAVDQPAVVTQLERALRTARAADLMVVFVRVAFRPGYPEVDDRNFTVRRAKADRELLDGDTTSAIDPRLVPLADEVVVTKRRTSAFTGTDLEIVLRAKGIETIALAGITTGGVVLSTQRAAADLDIPTTVLADACADPDAEVHQVLVNKVFPRQATVRSVEDWARTLGDAS